MSLNIDELIKLMKRFTPNENFNEFNEQDSAGQTTSSGEKPEYPTVTKWATGRKFGPTYNPEQKTWASGVVRGKANTLL
jgi:hypothetical protein